MTATRSRTGCERTASSLAAWRSCSRSSTALASRVESVALAGYLHDVGRSPLVAGDTRDHNELGALILMAEGLEQCARLALRHPVYAVHDPRTAPRDLAERIVYYADRRAGMGVLPLDERITETAVHHPRYAASIEAARPIARDIERAVYEGLATRPEDLARAVAERWP